MCCTCKQFACKTRHRFDGICTASLWHSNHMPMFMWYGKVLASKHVCLMQAPAACLLPRQSIWQAAAAAPLPAAVQRPGSIIFLVPGQQAAQASAAAQAAAGMAWRSGRGAHADTRAACFVAGPPEACCCTGMAPAHGGAGAFPFRARGGGRGHATGCSRTRAVPCISSDCAHGEMFPLLMCFYFTFYSLDRACFVSRHRHSNSLDT